MAFDVGVSVLVAFFTAVGPSGTHPQAPRLIGFAMAAVLLARRRWPVWVMAAIGALALAQVLLRPDGTAVLYDVAVLIAAYSAVKYGRTLRDCLFPLAPLTAGILVELWRNSVPGYRWMAAFWYVSVCAGVWAVGYTMRTRRLYVASLEDRAATAEREREHLTRIAVANERAAIARELHDIVAHSLAVMVVQAEGAAYTMDRDSEAARGAIKQVAATGRESLDDMRRLVHLLRDGMAGDPYPGSDLADPGDAGTTGTALDGAGQDGAAPDSATAGPECAGREGTVAPGHAGTGQPATGYTGAGYPDAAALIDRRRVGIDQVGALVERARSAGLTVTMRAEDLPPKLPPGVELAAYRIVQESLTNVLRHAGPGATVAVHLRYQDATLGLDITDDGGPAGAVPEAAVAAKGRYGGNGLIGMRERVAAHGGRFSAGRHGNAGWRVRATIPLSPAPALPEPIP